MATFKLDDIRAAAEAKFGHTDIELPDGQVVRLLNALQLPKEKRDLLTKSQDDGDEDRDQVEVFQNMIRIVARSDHEAEKLINAAGDNVAFLVGIFDAYGKSTQLGEA